MEKSSCSAETLLTMAEENSDVVEVPSDQDSDSDSDPDELTFSTSMDWSKQPQSHANLILQSFRFYSALQLNRSHLWKTTWNSLLCCNTTLCIRFTDLCNYSMQKESKMGERGSKMGIDLSSKKAKQSRQKK